MTTSLFTATELTPRAWAFPVLGEDAGSAVSASPVVALPLRKMFRQDERPSVFAQPVAQEAPRADEAADDGDNLVELSVQAYAEGFARGRLEGEAAAREEGRIAVSNLMSIAERVGGHRAEVAADLEASVVELAMLVAERVLHAEVSAASAQLAARLAAAGVERLGRCEQLAVRVHPSDLAHVKADAALAGANIAFSADAALAPGDAIVESEVGRVDGRMRAMLDEVQATLCAPELEESR